MDDVDPRSAIRAFGFRLLLVADGLFLAALFFTYAYIRANLPAWPDEGARISALPAWISLAACALAAAAARVARTPLLPALLLLGASGATLALYLAGAGAEGRYRFIVVVTSGLLLLHQWGGVGGAVVVAAKRRTVDAMPYYRQALLFLLVFQAVTVGAVFVW